MRRSLLPLLLAIVFLGSACATQAPPDTLKKVKESGSLAIGYRESSVPFSFVNLEKQPSGYSVDLCKRIAAAVQQQLGLSNLQIKWVPVTPRGPHHLGRQRHGRHRVRVDDQYARAPGASGLHQHDLRRRGQPARHGGVGDQARVRSRRASGSR